MAEPSQPDASRSSSPQPDDMHWAISYLREDIQDILLELRDSRRSLEDKMGGLEDRVGGRIDALRRELNTRFYWLVGLVFMSWLSTMSTILIKL